MTFANLRMGHLCRSFSLAAVLPQMGLKLFSKCGIVSMEARRASPSSHPVRWGCVSKPGGGGALEGRRGWRICCGSRLVFWKPLVVHPGSVN